MVARMVVHGLLILMFFQILSIPNSSTLSTSYIELGEYSIEKLLPTFRLKVAKKRGRVHIYIYTVLLFNK